MSPLCANKESRKKPMNASMHWSECSISVVRREHTFKIEELLERVLALRIRRVLTYFHCRRIIRAWRVSDVKRSGFSPSWRKFLATSGDAELDWGNSAHVEFITSKHLTVTLPCSSAFPRIIRITEVNVVQRSSAQRSTFHLGTELVTWCNREREVLWSAVYGGEGTRCRRRMAGT